MSRRCELTAKGPQVGHKVSHSNIKTKRRFLPNLVNVTFISDALARNVLGREDSDAARGLAAYVTASDAALAQGDLDRLLGPGPIFPDPAQHGDGA